MNWIYGLVVDPFDYPHGWFAYLLTPTVIAAALTLVWPRRDSAGLTVLAVALSIPLFFGVYVWLYGVSSTLPLGIMFAIAPHTVAARLAVGLTRFILGRPRRTP